MFIPSQQLNSTLLSKKKKKIRFHTLDYVQKVQSVSNEKGGSVGHDVTLSQGGYEIAQLSAGSGLVAIEKVITIPSHRQGI